MGRDRLLRIGIVVFLGVGVVGAGLNAFFAEVVIALVQFVALLAGLALIGYVIVRGELPKPERRSGVGNAGAGASIAVSGAVIVNAGEFGAIGTFLGAATFVVGTVAFCYGAVGLFDVELPRIERWVSR